MNRRKVQIRFPARLFIDGKCLRDLFPEWFQVLSTDRLESDICLPVQKPRHETSTNARCYSNSTVIDD